MEARLAQIRVILNKLIDQNGGSPSHSGKGRFWNLSRDEFVKGPIYHRTPIVPGHPDQSFVVAILQGSSDGIARMPLNGPYISDTDLQFIIQWIQDGAPDVDHLFKSEFDKKS